MGNTVRVLAAVAVVLCLGACGFAPGSSSRAKRTPVPDEELYAQIAAMPHVLSVDLQHDDARFGYDAAYFGDVVVDDSVVAVCVLDDVNSVLWRGGVGYPYTVRVKQAGKYVDDTAIWPDGGAKTESWDDRYGMPAGLGPSPSPRPPLPSGVMCE